MADHEEIFVKVNAPVDRGIAPLVEALSAIPDLETLESCQGDPDSHKMAYVFFRYRDWQAAGELLFEQILGALDEDLRAEVSVSLTAYDTSHAQGRIAVEQSAMPALINVIRSVSSDRMSQCSGGTGCT